MAEHQTVKNLTETLIAHLGKPLILDRKDVHFLSSTFSVTTLEELEGLSHPNRCDDLGLFLEMTLSPSLTVRKTVEPLVWDTGFSHDLELKLTAALTRGIPRLSFAFQDPGESITLIVPSAYLTNYVKKLRLTRPMPAPLLSIMDECLTLPQKVETCVKLRQSPISLDEPRVEFLKIFITEAQCFGEDFSAHVDFIVSLMDRETGSQGMENALLLCLRRLRKIRDQIRSAEDMMKKNSMEALMMKGFVVPPQSPEDIDARIAMASRVLSCIYGRVDTCENPVSDIDLGHHGDGESMEHVIRLLS